MCARNPGSPEIRPAPALVLALFLVERRPVFGEIAGMHHRVVVGFVLLFFALGIDATRAFDLVLLRSADTLADKTENYSAFNERHFSEDGLKQIEHITAALGSISFDAILTSPSYSALRTIQPYVEKSGQQAEIWPTLFECCRQQQSPRKRSAPGIPILLEPEQRALFVRRADSPDVIPGDEADDEGEWRIRRVANDIKRLWLGSDVHALMVVDAFAGARLLHALTDDSATKLRSLEPGRFTHLREEGGRLVAVDVNARSAPDLPLRSDAR